MPLPELTHRASVAPVALTPGDAVREGHRIARAIIARATAQATAIQAAAEEQGRDQGLRLALETEGPALREAAGALAGAAARLEATRRELAEDLSRALPALAVAIAGAVLRRELSLRPETLVELVHDAVATVLPAARVEVRVHPEDLDALERHRGILREALGDAELRLEPSADVGRGGCFIETESLTLAAGLPQQLERALSLLAGTPA